MDKCGTRTFRCSLALQSRPLSPARTIRSDIRFYIIRRNKSNGHSFGAVNHRMFVRCEFRTWTSDACLQCHLTQREHQMWYSLWCSNYVIMHNFFWRTQRQAASRKHIHIENDNIQTKSRKNSQHFWPKLMRMDAMSDLCSRSHRPAVQIFATHSLHNTNIEQSATAKRKNGKLMFVEIKNLESASLPKNKWSPCGADSQFPVVDICTIVCSNFNQKAWPRTCCHRKWNKMPKLCWKLSYNKSWTSTSFARRRFSGGYSQCWVRVSLSLGLDRSKFGWAHKNGVRQFVISRNYILLPSTGTSMGLC